MYNCKVHVAMNIKHTQQHPSLDKNSHNPDCNKLTFGYLYSDIVLYIAPQVHRPHNVYISLYIHKYRYM